MTAITPGASPEAPVYMKWLRSDEGIDWGKVLLALALTAATGYLAARAQRAGSGAADPLTSLRMKAAQKQISAGARLQRAGRLLEERGWAGFEAARPQ